MSMQSEGKDAKGRNYHQSTKDGTGSAASVGTGGTGDIGSMGSESVGQGNQQSSRSDDLLAGDTTHQEADQAFSGGSASGQVQTGMEGIGQGANRQSGQKDQNRQGGNRDSGQTDADQYDQGTAPRES